MILSLLLLLVLSHGESSTKYLLLFYNYYYYLSPIGKMRFLNDKRKGDKTNSTGNPTSKLKTSERRSVQDDDKPTTQGWRQTGSKATKRRQHSVYTCWGRSECPKWEGITTLYSGKLVNQKHRGGGVAQLARARLSEQEDTGSILGDFNFCFH